MTPSRFGLLIVICQLAASGDAQGQDGPARACTSINDPVARLACYDRAMSREVQPVPAVAPAAGQVSGPSGAPPTAAGEAAFGLPLVTRAPAQATSLVSRIVGPFDGWQASTRWKLANGQVWAIADGSSSGYPTRNDPQVRVQQGAFGGYFIDIEGVSQSPRVRRLY